MPLRHRLTAGIAGSILLLLGSATPAHAADESISVDFSASAGSPTYRASGWIYGMTENASGPADHFYTDLKFQAMRAGGAQLDNPGGWVAGTYDRRWASTLAQAKRTTALGGSFVLLVHDLWGADSISQSVWPGANGDWSSFDAFYDRVISDVKASGLNLQWDIWNEPDNRPFWGASQAQYLEMWKRAYPKIRAAFPNSPIVGPSTYGKPSTSTAWWTTYLDYVKANNVVPDIWSFHTLPGDPVLETTRLRALLDARALPHTRPFQINEYASTSEQNPGDTAWYITRLERAGAQGLRAHWGSSQNLHNDLANMLVRNSAGQHLPMGDWWVYRFYAGQTGLIAATTPSPAYDAFATKADGSAKILVGGGGTTGNIAVGLNRLDTTTGIVINNQVRVRVQRIPYNAGGAVPGPVTVADSTTTVTGNAITVNLPHSNTDDTLTITLLPPTDSSFPSVAVAQHSQQCLDNTNLATSNGNRQQQYYCEGGDQQLWNFRPVTGVADTYTLVNQQTGKCLDISGAATADGSAAVQWTCLSGATNQQFTLRKVTYTGNDAHDYQLVARHSGKCVDVSGISTAARAAIHQWTCNPTAQSSPANQTWRLLGR